jgi:hypothetical protein
MCEKDYLGPKAVFLTAVRETPVVRGGPRTVSEEKKHCKNCITHLTNEKYTHTRLC